VTPCGSGDDHQDKKTAQFWTRGKKKKKRPVKKESLKRTNPHAHASVQTARAQVNGRRVPGVSIPKGKKPRRNGFEDRISKGGPVLKCPAMNEAAKSWVPPKKGGKKHGQKKKTGRKPDPQKKTNAK